MAAESPSSEKANDFVSVEPCRGWAPIFTHWSSSCVFCARRFGEWFEASEENLSKIPPKPGIFQVALKYRNVMEVVKIVLEHENIRKVMNANLAQAKELVTTKKEYELALVCCRWVTFKQDNKPEVSVICAHWFNHGVLPKLSDSWPGLDILQKNETLLFSDELQKWCYQRRVRQPAQLEVVKGCTWSQCEICDTYFTEWKKVDSVIANDKAPDAFGIFLLAVSCDRQINVIDICYGPCILLNIKLALVNLSKCRQHILKENDYANKNAFFLTRWAELNDIMSNSACFLYAHWLNAKNELRFPKFPGLEIVKRNRHFTFRSSDNKWYHEKDAFKKNKTTQCHQKKYILNELNKDIFYLDC